jgi:hypothetical protein
MRGKVGFLAGFAIGYVLGSKAGRQRYEQIVSAVRKVRASPTVQEATGMVQAQTSRLVSTGREAVRHKMQGSRLGNSRIGQRLLRERDTMVLDEDPARPHPQGF